MNKFKSKFLPIFVVAVFVLAISPQRFSLGSESAINAPAETATAINQDQEQWLKDQLGEGLDVRDQIASDVVSDQFVQQISAVEWLAPLAPVALSPFFGITLLSGLACYGPDWLPDNALLSDRSPLANPTMFWTFLILTVLTSAPRFSKVSKPIAQLADFLETYSAVVILLVLKVVSMSDASDSVAQEAIVPVQAGILSVGWEGMIMLAMAINIVVVNTVKFFFEFMVWITPVPFLDACFEVANKAICAGLMAVYAYSPPVALIINLTLFVVCAFAFVWIKRREVFYRTMLLDWIIKSYKKMTSSSAATSVPDELIVFTVDGIDNVPAKARCQLTRKDGHWDLHYRPFLKSPVHLEISGPAKLKQGWWTNNVDFGDGVQLTFSSRHNENMPMLAERMEFVVSQSGDVALDSRRKVEFA